MNQARSLTDGEWEIKRTQAFELYLTFHSPTEISTMIEVVPETIVDWISKHLVGEKTWKELRKEKVQESLAEMADRLPIKAGKLTHVSMALVTRTLEAKLKDPRPLTIQEAKMVSDIGLNFDKLMRLATGQATDTMEMRNTTIPTIQELKDAIDRDFMVHDLEAGEDGVYRSKEKGGGSRKGVPRPSGLIEPKGSGVRPTEVSSNEDRSGEGRTNGDDLTAVQPAADPFV